MTKGSGAKLSAWVGARHAALDRLANYSKMAIDAGVPERRLRIAEHHGVAIGNLMARVLGDLNLSDEQRAVAPEVVHRHLTLLESSLSCSHPCRTLSRSLSAKGRRYRTRCRAATATHPSMTPTDG